MNKFYTKHDSKSLKGNIKNENLPEIDNYKNFEVNEKSLGVKLKKELQSNSYDYIPIQIDSETKKRKDRLKLPGYKCDLCQPYFESLNLNEKDLKARLNHVSRHRGKSPPKTPEYFWELDFPDTEECLKRNYTSVIPEPTLNYEYSKTSRLVRHYG